MPLAVVSLSSRLRSKLVVRNWFKDSIELTQLCDDIAEAVVEEIQANAQVNPTLLVAPSGGGPVTGTGTVT